MTDEPVQGQIYQITGKAGDNCISNGNTWAESNTTSHNFKKGDILVCHWGYDQTNVDFYQVTGVPSSKSIKIRKIKNKETYTSPMHGITTPLKGEFVNNSPNVYNDDEGNEKLKKPYHFMGKWHIKINSYSSAQLWDGKEEFFSETH